MHKNDLDRIFNEIKDIPKLIDLFINGIFESTFDYMKYFISSVKDKPEQRYLNLIKEKPEVVNEFFSIISLFILCITTVHLSSIKSKLSKEKPTRI